MPKYPAHVESDHDCGSYACPTCGPELRAAVERCKAAPLDERLVSEARSEIGMDVITSVVDQELVADFVLGCRDGQGVFAGHTAGVALLQSGMTFEDIATASGLNLFTVVRKFTEIGPADLGKVLEAERLLRAGAESCGVVARAAGLSREQVLRLSDAMGVETAAVTRQRTLGANNRKYTPEQIEQAYVLKIDQGLSAAKVAVLMGLKDHNSVTGILKRNPRVVSDSERVIETVAA